MIGVKCDEKEDDFMFDDSYYNCCIVFLRTY